MEKICEHCGDLFIVKRKDVVYCSASCKQMAYLNRRLNAHYTDEINNRVQLHDTSNHKPSIDGLQNSKENNETSIDTLNKNNEPSIDILNKHIEPSIDDLENNHSETTNDVSTEFEQETTNNLNTSNTTNEPTQTYKDINSRFLTAISELSDQRDYISVLNSCLYVHQNAPCFEVSERLKCLTECLLLFSEMKTTDIEDLKEVCNAFTLTIGSSYYKELPTLFPYTAYLVLLRNKLKQLIIENHKEKHIAFRLSTESKIELMATRYELSYFCTKQKFCDINFSE